MQTWSPLAQCGWRSECLNVLTLQSGWKNTTNLAAILLGINMASFPAGPGGQSHGWPERPLQSRTANQEGRDWTDLRAGEEEKNKQDRAFKDILIDTFDTVCSSQNHIFSNALSLLLNC